MKQKNFRKLIAFIRLMSVIGGIFIMISRTTLIIFQINVF